MKACTVEGRGEKSLLSGPGSDFRSGGRYKEKEKSAKINRWDGQNKKNKKGGGGGGWVGGRRAHFMHAVVA